MLNEFSYADVRLTGGPLKEQFDRTLAYYTALDDDRILKVYRQAAGLPAPGEEMGGWYDPGAFAPGHSFGQWMSALSRFTAITGNTELRKKVERWVDGFAATLSSDRSFYDGHRFKAYVYDKHVVGLTDAYRWAGIKRAREVLAKATDIALRYIPAKAMTRADQAAQPHKDVSYTWDESYTLAENLFLANEATGDARYREMAPHYLLDKVFYEPLARGENVLVGQHAYSHVNALCSAAKAYLVTGNQMHLRAACNAWEMIDDQSYASGGWGPNETFIEPGQGLLAASLATTHKHFETPCGTHAHFKLARYLLRATNLPKYGDGLETRLYNGILAAKPMGPDGQTFYYSDYSAAANKTYHPDKWPCCSGTYPQVVSEYGISAYFHQQDHLYVNLYIPSELDWRLPAGDVIHFRQETSYPLDSAIQIHLKMERPTPFSIHLRAPAWAAPQGIARVASEAFALRPGTFTEIRRTWKSDEVLKIDIPLTPRVLPVDPRRPDLVATVEGPLLMVNVEMGRRVPFFQVRDERYTTYTDRRH